VKQNTRCTRSGLVQRHADGPEIMNSGLRPAGGVSTWTARDMAQSLKISVADAKHVIAILELQGYVKRTEGDEWMTTLSGEEVSDSTIPRYRRERIERALEELRSRMAGLNRNANEPYKIERAVAFGDFLSDRPRAQSAEVGVRLLRRGDSASSNSAEERKTQQAFLRRLQGRGGLLHVRPFEEWMSARTHRKLLTGFETLSYFDIRFGLNDSTSEVHHPYSSCLACRDGGLYIAGAVYGLCVDCHDNVTRSNSRRRCGRNVDNSSYEETVSTIIARDAKQRGLLGTGSGALWSTGDASTSFACAPKAENNASRYSEIVLR
jgi:DNA-binding MarR family transcriptional regulator